MNDFPGVKVQSNNFIFEEDLKQQQPSSLAKSEYIPLKTDKPLVIEQYQDNVFWNLKQSYTANYDINDLLEDYE